MELMWLFLGTECGNYLFLVFAALSNIILIKCLQVTIVGIKVSLVKKINQCRLTDQPSEGELCCVDDGHQMTMVLCSARDPKV